MKRISHYGAALVFGCLALVLSLGCQTTGPSSVPQGGISTEKKLVVAVDFDSAGRLVSYWSRNDALYHFEQAVREVADEHGYTGDLSVEFWPNRDDEQVINVLLNEWRYLRDRRVRFAASAFADLNGQSYDFGVVDGNEWGLDTAVGRDQQDRIYIEAARQAVDDLWTKLGL